MLVAALDISGQRYGRLVALSRVQSTTRKTKWLFACDCGNEVVRELEPVRRGDTRSCGCLRQQVTRDRSITHGHKVGRVETRTMKSYSHAKARCLNPNDEKYPVYGGRGIIMCKRWVDSFADFLADMGECPPGLTLDRIDVNGNYEPRNCRWATAAVQARNRTNNVFVLHEGETMILKDYAARMGVAYKALHARVKYRGQTPSEAAASLKG